MRPPAMTKTFRNYVYYPAIASILTTISIFFWSWALPEMKKINQRWDTVLEAQQETMRLHAEAKSWRDATIRRYQRVQVNTYDPDNRLQEYEWPRTQPATNHDWHFENCMYFYSTGQFPDDLIAYFDSKDLSEVCRNSIQLGN